MKSSTYSQSCRLKPPLTTGILATLMRCFLLIVAFPIHAQTFSDFLTRLNSMPEDTRGTALDSFMASVAAFPYIENDTTVHFIYRGAASSVTIPGDANGWNPGGYPMTHVPGTDLWYYTATFEPDARLDYKFLINDSTWILDPLNPHQMPGGYGTNSELRMPKYTDPPEIEYYPEIPHGTTSDTTFTSQNLGNSRTIRVYTPPSYDLSSDSLPFIIFHDGLEYLTLAQANNVLDYLIAQKRIQPVIAVFVPPVNRTEEYAGNLNQKFMAFVVNELVPWIEQRFRTRREPSSRAVMGASYGGNISLMLALRYPGVFGNVAAQSGYISTTVSGIFRNAQRLNLRIYLDLGTYDVPSLIPMVRNFIPILESKGYAYVYREYHEGHSWGNWRAHIDDALEYFFGKTQLEKN